MRPPFAAYQGSEAYSFVCYSHADSEVVYPELIWLKDQGLNIWYDEGISPGTIWREELVRAIEGAKLLLFYISPASLQSKHCLREINFATDQDLNLLAIYLEPTTLPRALRLSILYRQALLRYQLPIDEYRAKLCGAMKRIIERPSEELRDLLRPQTHSLAKDRIHIAVATASTDTAPLERAIAGSMTEYLSWQGGIYRAYRLTSDSHVSQQRIDYRIVISTHLDTDDMEVSWQVLCAGTGEIVWANRSRQAAAQLNSTYRRAAEMISEGALKTIVDHELQSTVGHSSGELGYAQLIIRAEQLNYLDRPQVAERLEGLKHAIKLEPLTASAHACLAQLLSWQIINGASDDVARDETTVREEAKLAIKYGPNDPHVLLSIGTTYCRLGRYEGGLGLLRRACDLAPTAYGKDQLARGFCFAGQPENAIPLFEDILSTMPVGHTYPYVRLAIALTQAGRLVDAVKYSTDGVLHFSEDYYSWLVHANLLAQLGRKDQAQNAVDEARRLLPKLRLQRVINGTEATYGRTPEQRKWLTTGLRSLLPSGEVD